MSLKCNYVIMSQMELMSWFSVKYIRNIGDTRKRVEGWSIIWSTREKKNGAMFVEKQFETADKVNHHGCVLSFDSSGHIFILHQCRIS